MTKVFITGATGFIGSKLTKELIANGYEVTGLTHSDNGVSKLHQWGASVLKGSLEDYDLLAEAATQADAVLHLGMGVTEHFKTFPEICELDERDIRAMGDAVKGTQKPLIVTHGTAAMLPGQFFTEQDEADAGFPQRSPRKSEVVARELLAEGVNSYVVRLAPIVHGEGDQHHGFVSNMIAEAQTKGFVENYNGGENRWTAVHVLDAAHLFVLALEYALSTPDGLHFFNANDEEQLKMKDLRKEIGAKLRIEVKDVYADPQRVDSAFTQNEAEFPAQYVLYAMDIPASSKLTRQALKWEPTHPQILADMNHYFDIV
ncbi:SDR family oxidoreductase [Pediococcus argentinicus]|uniref:NAD-dependent epimerase/dehydratase domain-containing protein n=1 Tax=Pediococcus argentinicus TaxID=480391 RepID=A0A0R2N8P0_9LACO|nr:SDR family oxidoreductase [Pediococcus argentinicus]KRO20811.1 hypothetical protein IV88_GL001490 [Pediococcus argentinicus]NKZ22611.1 SDR family oxidoreductase [Pediococcus argentinicus]GEP20364.1 short-chain dehydrogenase [Pediococcus argentinicus]